MKLNEIAARLGIVYVDTGALYRTIGLYMTEKGVDVKADLYLLDVSTKELWTEGDIKEAISSIFNSVSDVLVVYPLFTELAKNRLSSNENEVVEYLKSRIDETKNTDELKSVFTNLIDVYNATKFDMNTNVNELFKTHANGFIEAANSDDDIIKKAIEPIEDSYIIK